MTKPCYMTLAGYVLGDTCSYLLGDLLGECHKNETIKHSIFIFPHLLHKAHPKKCCISQFYVTPDDGLIRVFLLFHFYDTHLEVSLISINLQLTPDSYKLIF